MALPASHNETVALTYEEIIHTLHGSLNTYLNLAMHVDGAPEGVEVADLSPRMRKKIKPEGVAFVGVTLGIPEQARAYGCGAWVTDRTDLFVNVTSLMGLRGDPAWYYVALARNPQTRKVKINGIRPLEQGIVYKLGYPSPDPLIQLHHGAVRIDVEGRLQVQCSAPTGIEIFAVPL